MDDLFDLMGPDWVPSYSIEDKCLNLYSREGEYSLRIKPDGTFEKYIPSDMMRSKLNKVADRYDRRN